MLFLLFQLANDLYALDTREIVEVLPLVNVKQIPQAPRAVCGLFDYHGATVPLVDLSELAHGTPSRRMMSTRIALLRYASRSGGEQLRLQYPGSSDGQQLLGLILERARATLRRSEEDFSEADVAGASFLGAVTREGDAIIQRISVEHLLPPEVRDQLFQGRR
jgi:chemotaxis-related protein WspB